MELNNWKKANKYNIQSSRHEYLDSYVDMTQNMKNKATSKNKLTKYFRFIGDIVTTEFELIVSY